jgi:hypothetical protein
MPSPCKPLLRSEGSFLLSLSRQLDAIAVLSGAIRFVTAPDACIGWVALAALWQPARAVAVTCDFVYFPDELGIVVADVSDKGVPAAAVMANLSICLSVLSTDRDEYSRRTVNHAVNDIVCDDILKVYSSPCHSRSKTGVSVSLTRNTTCHSTYNQGCLRSSRNRPTASSFLERL